MAANRGDWLLSELQAALEAGSLFTVVDNIVAGKAPPTLPAVYVELLSERYTQADEAADSVEGESLFYLVAFFQAASNDGSSPALAAARNATAHNIEKLLVAISPADIPKSNTDAAFKHTLRSVGITNSTGQLDDKGRFGILVAEVTVTWLRESL